MEQLETGLPRWTDVRWEADGSYTPVCRLCGWEGKRRAVHADARTAARGHARGVRHREDAEALARAERD